MWTDSTGEVVWMKARRKKNTRAVVLDKMKMPVEHRKKKSKYHVKKSNDKTPRDLGPGDNTVLLYNCAETVMSHANGSTVNILWDKIPRENWTSTKDVTFLLEKEDCWTNFENRQLREDEGTDIGAQGQRRVVLDRCDDSETWKAVNVELGLQSTSVTKLWASLWTALPAIGP